MNWSDRLWGKSSSVGYLLIAALLLLFTSLGSREIWTQEHRWADIVSAMFYYHDFLHPVLNGQEYYDKPLLSYWLMAGLSRLFGDLNLWALRLPSALAGLVAIGCIYRLGTRLKDRSLGLLAGWMLLTTFYFLFWARTSNADMLNVAGTLGAVTWYVEKKQTPGFLNDAMFFFILALTALCKGLVGPAVVFLAILPDLLRHHHWKTHAHPRLLAAMIPAAIIYLLPFVASSYFSANGYHQNGLYLVYKENILRYFQPFDHKGPLYAYFLFLPLYMIPWSFFFIPALFDLKSRWNALSSHSKWLAWIVFILFLFFTFSGSRRNYYILPVVPFAILMTADWILANNGLVKRSIWAGRLAVYSFLVFFLGVGLQSLYYSGGGIPGFAKQLIQTASTTQPWSHWNVVMLDPESKIRFYLKLSPEIKNLSVKGEYRQQLKTTADLLQTWPVLKTADRNTIFITRKKYDALLQNILKPSIKIEAKRTRGERFFGVTDNELPIAYIPKPV